MFCDSCVIAHHCVSWCVTGSTTVRANIFATRKVHEAVSLLRSLEALEVLARRRASRVLQRHARRLVAGLKARREKAALVLQRASRRALGKWRARPLRQLQRDLEAATRSRNRYELERFLHAAGFDTEGEKGA